MSEISLCAHLPLHFRSSFTFGLVPSSFSLFLLVYWFCSTQRNNNLSRMDGCGRWGERDTDPLHLSPWAKQTKKRNRIKKDEKKKGKVQTPENPLKWFFFPSFQSKSCDVCGDAAETRLRLLVTHSELLNHNLIVKLNTRLKKIKDIPETPFALRQHVQ